MERTRRPILESGQELNGGSAQIRTLLDRQKEQILAECQAEIKEQEFQVNYARRSIQKLSATTESQQEQLHRAQAEELERRDQQLLHAQLLQQNSELREAHHKSHGRIQEVPEFHFRHYSKTKIGRGSGYYSGTYLLDTGIEERN